MPGKAARAAAASCSQVGRLGPDAAGQRAFQVAGRRDRDPGRADGDALDLALHVVQVAPQHLEIVGGLAVGVDAGKDDLEDEVGARGAGQLAVGLGEAGVVALARVELGDEVGRAERPQRLDQLRAPPAACSAGTARPTAGIRATSRDFDRDGDGIVARPRPWPGGLAGHGQRDALAQLLALGDRVGPGQGERPDIGLVGGVQPVALVLHLEGVALHAAGDAQARQRLVGQGADVHERAGGVDQLGKAAVLDAAVDPLDLDRGTADALQRDAGRRSRSDW